MPPQSGAWGKRMPNVFGPKTNNAKNFKVDFDDENLQCQPIYQTYNYPDPFENPRFGRVEKSYNIIRQKCQVSIKDNKFQNELLKQTLPSYNFWFQRICQSEAEATTKALLQAFALECLEITVYNKAPLTEALDFAKHTLETIVPRNRPMTRRWQAAKQAAMSARTKSKQTRARRPKRARLRKNVRQSRKNQKTEGWSVISDSANVFVFSTFLFTMSYLSIFNLCYFIFYTYLLFIIFYAISMHIFGHWRPIDFVVSYPNIIPKYFVSHATRVISPKTVAWHVALYWPHHTNESARPTRSCVHCPIVNTLILHGVLGQSAYNHNVTSI